MKNRWKMDQKSSKNQSKNKPKHRPKINQHRPKIDQKSTKIPPGPMGYPTWADGVPLFWSRAQVVLDLGALLGSSWRRHGSVLGGKSGQHGSNLASSWHPRRRQNPSWAVLEPSWEPLGGLIYPILCIFDAFELHALENMHLRQILYEFLSKKCSTEITKLFKLYYENSIFLLSGDFHIR